MSLRQFWTVSPAFWFYAGAPDWAVVLLQSMHLEVLAFAAFTLNKVCCVFASGHTARSSVCHVYQ